MSLFITGCTNYIVSTIPERSGKVSVKEYIKPRTITVLVDVQQIQVYTSELYIIAIDKIKPHDTGRYLHRSFYQVNSSDFARIQLNEDINMDSFPEAVPAKLP